MLCCSDIFVTDAGNGYSYARVGVSAGDQLYISVAHTDETATAGYYNISVGNQVSMDENPPILIPTNIELSSQSTPHTSLTWTVIAGVLIANLFGLFLYRRYS